MEAYDNVNRVCGTSRLGRQSHGHAGHRGPGHGCHPPPRTWRTRSPRQSRRRAPPTQRPSRSRLHRRVGRQRRRHHHLRRDHRGRLVLQPQRRSLEQARASNGGFIWAGVGVRAELRRLRLPRPEHRRPAGSRRSSTTPPTATRTPTSSRCAPTAAATLAVLWHHDRRASSVSWFLALRYQFRQGHAFRPYLGIADVGGGEWRGALNIDGSRPAINGAIDDNSSAYQPTDVQRDL